MSQVDLIEFVKHRANYAGKWRYSIRSDKAGFAWTTGSLDTVPAEPGIYFLLSHNSTRLQKIGKAEGAKGLIQRLGQYTTIKSIDGKIMRDRTDRLWFSKMTRADSELCGQEIDIYWYITNPTLVSFEDGGLTLKLEAQWARSLERELNVIADKQGHCMELSGEQK